MSIYTYTCCCCSAKAKYDVSGGGLCCGRHLAYVVNITAPLGGEEALVTILFEKE